ncbi:hypothetical protein [Mesorhizobium sp. SARCC-RB16n]|uniref:hypothetical protein n=1 Tax=Mesorhizobium sp. SARCC-RB16n TaxID=2116687 RepID=UPI00122F9860|nr:hypothetical protein [Mesorhizobium sp. SARCC-RB16n]
MIDLWDFDTYDGEICEYLDGCTRVFASYLDEEKRLDEIVPPVDPRERVHFLVPTNRYYEAYRAAVEGLGPIMSTKTFRAFHYTRMTDDEVAALWSTGIVTTSLGFLKERVAQQVAAGKLTPEQGQRIVSKSALGRQGELDNRSGFWTVAAPVSPGDNAAKSLVDHWGGEGAYWAFGAEEPEMLELLKSIGCGRIIEIAVPLSAVKFGDVGAGSATIAFEVFASRLGYDRSRKRLDFNIQHDLAPDSLLKVHSEGDETYHGMGAGV